MVNFVDIVFFIYMFLALYMTSLFLFLYLPNRKNLFEVPIGKLEGISVVMPCYNEGKEIGEAIESLVKMDYPKELLEIIVIDDKSGDDSVKIIKKFANKYDNVRLIESENNSGGAATPINMGIRDAKFDYIAIVDADSTPEKDALKKMIGYLQNDKEVHGVTCSILTKKSENLVQKMQELEYIVIAFTRKLLDFVDSVYVAPGPLALYRKKKLIEVGLFDKENMTQDIEMTWKLMSHGYKTRMCLSAKVYSAAPKKFKVWLKQRIRWNIGGMQTLMKYRGLFFKRGMLGSFVIPLFSLSMFLGVFGLGFFLYLFVKRFITGFLSTKYATYVGTSLLSFQDFSFAPSIINFFAIVLFFIGFLFNVFGLSIIRGKGYVGRHNFLSLMLYLIVYLSVFPIILVWSILKFASGKYSW
jgi:cellulose synthase/poly-beta-1,6-N-acetylglucosamine synthase-like glycosyltransferase